MPQFSPSGRILSGDLIGTMTHDQWGWWDSETPVGYLYGDDPGLYTFRFPYFTRLGTYGAMNRRRFYAVGGRLWLSDLTTGAIDSDGQTFPEDRSACALSDQGDEVFILKANFATLLVRTPAGSEITIPAPGFNNAAPVTMDAGVLLWGDASGMIRAYGAADPSGPPGGDRRFTTALDGTRWITGYVSQWGLCLYRWVSDGTCQGYCLSTDGRDFYPDVWCGNDGLIHVASAQTQADTEVREYVVDIPGNRYRVGVGAWRSLVKVDLFKPPVPPIPPEPPVPPIPPVPPVPPVVRSSLLFPF